MTKLLGRFQEPAYSLARFAFGFLFAFHGAQKLFGVFGREPAGSLLIWIAGLVEFVCGLATAVGLFTSWAAFLCAGQMLVAYFYAHAGRGLLPITNGGELALLYLFGFGLFATRGSGKYGASGLEDAIKKAKGAVTALGAIGFFLGGLVGFLLRPSAFLVGQLPFIHVVSRGQYLKGLDEVLVPVAQESFNVMMAGAVLGAAAGAVVGYFVGRKNRHGSGTEDV